MSGGVDSSVAAALMVDQGHEVLGVTLKQWEGEGGAMPTAGCCTVGDAEDARRAAAQLDIPYYVFDYVDEFRAAVVDRFAAEYMAGRTPNPCIECNRRVRFSALLERTARLGCDVLVTGHHARIRTRPDGAHSLLKAKDTTKDQSYVLHMLGQAELSRIRLPVGEMQKSEVRELASSLGLRTATKPDSQDLCFVGHGDYRDFLREHHPETAIPGEIVDLEGTPLGNHAGTVDFTIGQRRGLGVALGEPRYVVDVEPDTARVVIGTKKDLEVRGCVVDGMSFVAGAPPASSRVQVKVRYRAKPVPAAARVEDHRWRVDFEEPQTGVAPGQAAVLYDGEEVLGGGTIVAPIRDEVGSGRVGS
jgi:tRNA-specific 2-thiouridylase